MITGRIRNIILLSFLFSVTGALADDVERFAVVIARGGLVLREKPSAQSKKLAVIPVNWKVYVKSYADREETIENVKARWANVTCFELRGWVFGGFLAPYSSIRFGYVKKRPGITLFENPSLTSRAVAAIPYREKVNTPMNEGFHNDVMTQRTFIKMEWKGQKGYAFDDELSYIPIPDYGIKYDPAREPAYRNNIEEFFNMTIYRFGRTKKEIVSRLGNPVKVSTRTEKNRYEPGKENIIWELGYDGLIITVMKTPSGSELLLNMEITSDRLMAKDAIVNWPLQRALDRFGIPDQDNGDSFSYIIGISGYCSMTLQAQKNKVSVIRLTCVPD